MATTTLNDTTFYWEEHGSGTPVVLLSGYSANHSFWMNQLPTLAKHHRVIILDNQGIGSTIDKGLPLTIFSMANEIAGLLEELGVANAAVVGHSMGGSLGICLATEHPHLVRHLVLASSTAKIRPLTRHVLTNLLDLRLSELKLFTLIQTMIPWFYSNESIADGRRPAELIHYFIEHQRTQSMRDQSRQLDAALAFDRRDMLGEIKVPTTVIAGEYDLLTPLADSEHLAQNIPNAKLFILKCAHNLPHELPQELNKLLLDALK